MLKTSFAIKFTFCFSFVHIFNTKVQNLIEGYLENGKQKFMKFWRKKHYTKKNNSGKFHPNPMHGFQETSHHHLQPICIFLEIHDVGFSNFWCGDELEW